MIIILVVIILLGLIITILTRRNTILKKNHHLLILQSQLFRSQTTPHFIFNSLMSIQTFLLDNKTEQASKYLVDFAKLIRSILKNTQKSLIPLEEEIESIKQYLRLEEMRFGDKFDVDIQVNIQFPNDIEFPPMLIQPHIENAIIHGLLPASKKGQLLIAFSEVNKQLRILVEDNGVGRSVSALRPKNDKHKSMGIKMTKYRIKLIAKRFKRKIDFKIVDKIDKEGKAAGTIVEFIMDLI